MSLWDPARANEAYWADPLHPHRDDPVAFLDDLRPLERLAALSPLATPPSSLEAAAQRAARAGIDHRVGGGWRLR